MMAMCDTCVCPFIDDHTYWCSAMKLRLQARLASQAKDEVAETVNTSL